MGKTLLLFNLAYSVETLQLQNSDRNSWPFSLFSHLPSLQVYKHIQFPHVQQALRTWILSFFLEQLCVENLTCISSSHLQHAVLQLLPLVCCNQNGKQCLKGILIVTALWSNGPVLVRSFEDIHHNLQNLRLKVRQEICQPIRFTWFYLSSAPSAETA